MTCPNCGSLMSEGDPCPECPHHDGDPGCDCAYCEQVWAEETAASLAERN